MNQNLSEDDGEPKFDRAKDDMASRRISSHIPAPLRKKRNEDQYKKFITPTGNPVAYLQQHMRSKSMSDLNEEKKEEENHRAEINMRYEEMEKLKVLLKEEEDTWTSKLQNWKNRRRSVTEDARKRKEERESLEKEAEVKSGHRKTKTYKQIVEDKIKRDKELAHLNDHDEYEYVSPRSSTSATGITGLHAVDVHIVEKKESMALEEAEDVFLGDKPDKSSTNDQVEYKYTTKVTAVINNPSELDYKARSSIPVDLGDRPRVPTYRSSISTSVETPTKNITSNQPQRHTVSTGVLSRQTQNSMPKVLLRSKGPSAKKERPKSAHDLPRGSSTLPRNYRDYSSPKPFTAGASNFIQYRKTAFANRRNMWENMSLPNSQTLPSDRQAEHGRHASDELLSSNDFGQIQSGEPKFNNNMLEPKVTRANRFEKLNSSPVKTKTGQSAVTHPAKVSLVSEPRVVMKQLAPEDSINHTITEVGLTATLSPSGLSMTSPRLSKASVEVTNSQQSEALFDDMKICINQRPRSEKGFGFTVRGGDDGKPVIVDTVSAGGAADVCQLCVSDEILAINEVPLADCKTQDDIVQLIVSSVITGNLSLNIRRYGKPKKASPLRLSGTKVVMTPGGFVQVRSDRPAQPALQRNVPESSFSHITKPVSTPVLTDGNNNEKIFDDLPPPPTQQELAEAVSSPISSTEVRESPLSDLITAASRDSNSERAENAANQSLHQDSSEDSFSGTALSEVHSNKNLDDDGDDLAREVLEAQKALDFEQYYQKGKQVDKEQLRLKLQRERKQLEEEEAQREEARKRLQEEARLQDMKVEEELRKIKERKLKQQQERRKEKDRLQIENQDRRMEALPAAKQPMRSNGLGQSSVGRHWMIEEAERRRVADKQGKPRVSALEQSRKLNPASGSVLPDHVIQHLTQRSAKPMGPRPFIRESGVYGGNPNAKATLL